MSHYAVNWALEQKDLKPAAKLVLICLADRHNKDTGECFPSQDRLAEDACVSRSSLNDQLNQLEALGYFTREKRIDPQTGRPLRTLYHLNIGFTPAPVDPDAQAEGAEIVAAEGSSEVSSMSEIRTRENAATVSENQGSPCPKNADIHVRNSDNNPVRLTRKINPTGAHACEPVREAAPEAEQQQVAEKKFSQGFWQDLLKALSVDLQEPGKWWTGPKAEAHVAGWLALGLSEDEILAAARKSRERHDQAPDGPKALDGVMKAAASKPKAEAPASQDQILTFWAEKLNSGAYVAASAIKVGTANALIAQGLVKPETLRNYGIAFTRRAA